MDRKNQDHFLSTLVARKVRIRDTLIAGEIKICDTLIAPKNQFSSKMNRLLGKFILL